MRSNGPYVHTKKTRLDVTADYLVALLPVIIWSVFMFGARVITLCALTVSCTFLLDFFVTRFALHAPVRACFDSRNAVYGLLAAFMMPVAVPMWIPAVSAILIVLAKNIRVISGKRLFNPFVFSAAVTSLVFRTQMTAFTRPFAYFNAFAFSLDEGLVSGYRVLSPLQYMSDGSVYEDGVMAQFYGYASGCLGEIAVLALLLGAIWLFIRKSADYRGTTAFLGAIFLLALAFPSDDAETNYFAYSTLLSGGIILLSVYAMNESCTVPVTNGGKWVFGAVCGVLTFVLRGSFGGLESGYYVILTMNIASPFIEKLTRPRVLGSPKKKERSRLK